MSNARRAQIRKDVIAAKYLVRQAALVKHSERRNECGCLTWWRGEGKAAKFYLKPCKPSCTVPNPEIERATREGGVHAVRIVYDGTHNDSRFTRRQ